MGSPSQKQPLYPLPHYRQRWKGIRLTAFGVVQSTHLIDAGVRDVVFLEKGIRTPCMTICSPPASPQDHSLAHPTRSTPTRPLHRSPRPHALCQAVTESDARVGPGRRAQRWPQALGAVPLCCPQLPDQHQHRASPAPAPAPAPCQPSASPRDTAWGPLPALGLWEGAAAGQVLSQRGLCYRCRLLGTPPCYTARC